MCGEDCREHPEWGTKDLYYIDLELEEDFSGLRWSSSEKTYDLEALVNVVIQQMRKTYPQFGLTGSLLAQGEDISDRWVLVIEDDGMAHRRPIEFTGKVVECPHCEEKFALES